MSMWTRIIGGGGMHLKSLNHNFGKNSALGVCGWPYVCSQSVPFKPNVKYTNLIEARKLFLGLEIWVIPTGILREYDFLGLG